MDVSRWMVALSRDEDITTTSKLPHASVLPSTVTFVERRRAVDQRGVPDSRLCQHASATKRRVRLFLRLVLVGALVGVGDGGGGSLRTPAHVINLVFWHVTSSPQELLRVLTRLGKRCRKTETRSLGNVPATAVGAP